MAKQAKPPAAPAAKPEAKTVEPDTSWLDGDEAAPAAPAAIEAPAPAPAPQPKLPTDKVAIYSNHPGDIILPEGKLVFHTSITLPRERAVAVLDQFGPHVQMIEVQ
jgi:hypothetical protein